MANRVYGPFMMFGVQIVNMQHLWNPSYEYKGQKQDKPSYFITCRVPKTRANWWEEPALAPAWAAYSEVLQKSGMVPQHVSEWPIRDGDMPAEPGKPPAEWAKGHWVFGGSSNNPIKVEIVQNGNPQPLPARVGVKPGDFVGLGLSAAIKANNPRALKHFCNTVLFMGAGEEIAIGNSVSGAELMQHAQRQGLQVAGFTASPGGMPGPGFSHGGSPGFAPTPGGSAFPQSASPPSFGPTGGAPNGSAYPSSPQGGPQPGFTPPQGSAPTQGFPAAGGVPGAPQPGFAGTPSPSNPPQGGQPQQWAPPPNGPQFPQR